MISLYVYDKDIVVFNTKVDALLATLVKAKIVSTSYSTSHFFYFFVVYDNS